MEFLTFNPYFIELKGGQKSTSNFLWDSILQERVAWALRHSLSIRREGERRGLLLWSLVPTALFYGFLYGPVDFCSFCLRWGND